MASIFCALKNRQDVRGNIQKFARYPLDKLGIFMYSIERVKRKEGKRDGIVNI